jgi:hypothetical protein
MIRQGFWGQLQIRNAQGQMPECLLQSLYDEAPGEQNAMKCTFLIRRFIAKFRVTIRSRYLKKDSLVRVLK